MKKRNYTRYKRYEREGGLVEWLIRTRPKLPRGKGGRPEKHTKRGKGGPIFAERFPVLAFWYGPGQDYELCQALKFSIHHPSQTVRTEARRVVLDKISQAFRKKDFQIFHRLSDSLKAVKEAPWNSLGVAVAVAHRILSDKGNKDPRAVELVETASGFFTDPRTVKELESLNSSLFREARSYLKHLASPD